MVKTGALMRYSHMDDVHMSERAKAYYGSMARGGVGLLIVESPVVDYPLGTRMRERYRADDDRFLPGLTELADTIHAEGCPTLLQLWHDGPWQNPWQSLSAGGPPPLYDGPPVGASAVNLPDARNDCHRDLPRELTVGEIEELVEKFVKAALRAQQAGFDGVDINAASSHLLHNFLSPFWNRREDAYGGSVANRARFTTDIVREVKRRAGPEFAVTVLMNGLELGRLIGIDDGLCLGFDEARQLAKLFEEAGADAIQVRHHWLGYHVPGFWPDYLFYPEAVVPVEQLPQVYNARLRGAGASVNLGAGLKQVVDIPVIIVGKLDPELGEQYLQEGKADFIAMTRRLQADPELPNKVAAGRPKDVAPCTACGTCLDQRHSPFRTCRINAAMGTEDYSLSKAATRKKVVVVGGGPAGMEAARVAALRGHDVTLYEKSRRLGGLMPLAALIKGSEPEDLPAMIRYFERQMGQVGVKTRLGKEVDAAGILALSPDVVIIATGGRLTVPEVEGVGCPNVVTAPQLHRRVKPFLSLVGPKTLDRLTHYWLPSVGKRVVVIGGGFHGCEIAEFLVKRGRKVTIVESSQTIGEGVLDFRLDALMSWFARRGVGLVAGASDIRVTPHGVSFNAQDGTRTAVDADTVIPTAPVTPNHDLADSLQGVVPEVYAIGDCSAAGMMVDAVGAGWRTARQI